MDTQTHGHRTHGQIDTLTNMEKGHKHTTQRQMDTQTQGHTYTQTDANYSLGYCLPGVA